MASRPGNKQPFAARALLRAGLVVSAAGAALAAGGAAGAQAAPADDLVNHALTNAQDLAAETEAGRGPSPQEAMAKTLPAVVGGVVGPVKHLQVDPFAGTGADPLANAIGTQIADFPEVSTADLTAPLTRGDTIGELPLARQVLGALPG
ncbi:hypothetical protein AAHZ94_26130 [Streptomyces sp. HSW2009]|uniref:hypothetical protein n=1 Tax=Streptomyces sp. HSW2009 TaxID=3142890 RepID=UPI0032EF8E40